MKTQEKMALGALMGFGAIVIVAFLVSLHIVIVAGLSMLLCNFILPMFDVNYPITFLQGCGIGVGVLIVRGLIGGVFSVNK